MPSFSASDSIPADVVSTLQSFQIVMIIFPTIAVALRFWSRALLPRRIEAPPGAKAFRFWWDDWFALFSLVAISDGLPTEAFLTFLQPLSIIGNAIAIFVVRPGAAGSPTIFADMPDESMLKANFAALFVWDAAVSLPKISALFFYDRVFGSSGRALRRALWLGYFLNLGWMFAMWIVTVCTCVPTYKYWRPMSAGTCMSPDTPWLVAVVPQMIIDLYVLILPLPLLWKLQLKPMRKFLVSCVFVCGYG